MTPVTQTLAKGPGQYINGVAPKYLKKGKGSHVWDVDGNEYLDYNMAIGPLSLGYGYPRVDEAIIEQLKDGITFSMMHELEVVLAELVHKIIPNAESIRISKTGADVTSAAVRVARAYTGRNKVLCCGYHGWHDWYISVTSRDSGIPAAVKDLSATFGYNDIQSVKDSLDEDTACVILEPFVFEAPANGFLQELKDLCAANGTLLIFDEMWTGFRIAVGGAQEYFGVTPDLACYSKAFANGMPISLLTGRRDVMKLFQEEVFFFTTFGGEALSLAAAVATIQEMIEKDVPAWLAGKGKKLKDGYNALAVELGMDGYTRCTGYDCRSLVSFDASAGNPLEVKSFVQQELIKRGILWAGFHNMSYSHTDEDVTYTLKAYREVLGLLKEAVAAGDVAARLKGKPVEAVFRKVSNFNMKPATKA
jgi:glutamate-1-semialdehyde aminotransferase